MKVLILGGNGILGPHAVKALEGHHQLRITDIVPIDSPHESMQVDVSDLDQVMEAAEGMEAIVNCSVLRQDRKLAFEVSTLGTYNAIRAAVEHKMGRFINTGPHFTITGPLYEHYDFGISTEVPPHAGTSLYALSKSAGQEICRIFTEHYPIHVLCLLFYNFRAPEPKPGEEGRDLTPFSVSFRDAGQAFKRGLEVDLDTLPSQNEVFFITTDLPHGLFSNEKARRLLGFEPQDKLEGYWRKPPARR
jgi:nucleoside-diphosphate-sugar epimerase